MWGATSFEVPPSAGAVVTVLSKLAPSRTLYFPGLVPWQCVPSRPAWILAASIGKFYLFVAAHLLRFALSPPFGWCCMSAAHCAA